MTTSASIGVTLFPADGDNTDILMRNADVAMYNAKWRGRDNYQFYTAEMNDRALVKMQLESRLRGALERNEFILHFQPKVSIEFGVVSGFEAAARAGSRRALRSWAGRFHSSAGGDRSHPARRRVGAARGLRSACALAGERPEAGPDRDQPVGAAAPARGLLRRRRSDARGVRCRAEPDRGRDHGKLADGQSRRSGEGAGPIEGDRRQRSRSTTSAPATSSLGYLKRFPFDTLKIDSSFVRDMNTDPDDALITRTIIALAHSLDLSVVAEGVENVAQLEFLAAHRCDEAQGYLFSVPVAAEAATAMLGRGEPLHAPSDVGVFGQPPAVLVVDAEVDSLVSLQQLLQRDGYLVLTANSLRDAVEVVPTQNIVAVIADEKLADSPGLELFERIRGASAHVVRILRVPVDSAASARPRSRAGWHSRYS